MPRLIWSEAALAGVQRLHRFLLSRNPDAARRAVSAIRSEVRLLAQHPHIGRRIEGMEDAFRDWIISFGNSGYVVRYHVGEDRVTILALRHQKEAGF